MIPHEEYSLLVRSPNVLALCVISGCVNRGEFALFVKDDKNDTVLQMDPLCAACLMVECIYAIQKGPTMLKELLGKKPVGKAVYK